MHVTGIAFDQTGPNSAFLHAINGENGNVSSGAALTSATPTANMGVGGFNGNIPQVFNTDIGAVAGLVLLGNGVLSRGGQIQGTVGENLTARELYFWTTATVAGHVQLVRINPGSNRAMLWGGIDPQVEIAGLTFDVNAIDPITQQPGVLIGSNPGIAASSDPTRDTISRIDMRFRPNEVNIFNAYQAVADENSMQSIYRVQIPPAPILPIPFTGDVGSIRITHAQTSVPTLVNPNGATGSVYIGARLRDISDDPFDDLWPVTSAVLRNSNGTASTTGFGLVPFGNGTITSGMSVARTATGAPQNFGRFLVAGALTGQVVMSGSADYFYASWLLLGDPNAPAFHPDSPGGAVAGLAYTYMPYSNTDHAGDFITGGDLRVLLTLDTIGSDDGSAFTGLQYITRGKFQIFGRLGMMDGREDLVGTVDVTNLANNPASMPLTEIQTEVETYTDGSAVAINSAFAAGYQAQPVFYNDTFDTPQYLGSINSTLGNNVIDLAGVTIPALGDTDDYYAVSLMAGQIIRVQQNNPLLVFELIDPDGRVVATNASDINAGEFATALQQWKADRPGLWRLHINNPTPFPLAYNIFLRSAPADTYGMNIALGAVHMTRYIFDGTDPGGGTSFNARNGDLGALISGSGINLVSPPDVLMTESAYETSGQPPQNALMGATINVTAGNLRTIQSVTIANPVADVYGGSVGLLSTTGDLVFNSSLAIPRANDHMAQGSARQVAIGGDYQRIQVGGNLAAGLMANRRIGVINAGSWGAVATQPLGFLVANADNRGRDGVIDLTAETGDAGTLATGGPGIMTGVGGNVRYMHVTGAVYRDAFFGGGLPAADDWTLYRPGESISFWDDSGTPMLIQPVTTVRGNPAASINLRTYGVRGSGGSVIVNIDTTDSVTISAQGSSPLASVEIGTITVNGAGTAIAPDANGRFVAPAAALPRLNLNLSGTAPVDVFELIGGDFYQIQNNSRATDSKRNVVDYGEIVNINVGSVYNLTAANIGVPKQSTDQPIIGNAPVLNTFPFLGQSTGVLVGNVAYINALGAIGNISSSGTIGQITADSDRKTTPGALATRVRAQLEGIVGPIYAAAGINTVTVGRGLTSSGNAPLISWGGLYSDGPINNVTADGADIYGDIVSTVSIGNVQIRNNGSLIWSDIIAGPTLDLGQEQVAKTNLPYAGPITDPGQWLVNNVYIQGAMATRTNPTPKTGGIIGSWIVGNRVNSMRVTRGFGLIDSAVGVYANGTVNQIAVDGYGIRDFSMVLGIGAGKMYAYGNGAQLASTNFSASVRKSETVDIDPFTRFPPNRATDLHRYLGTSTASPTIANDNNRAGVTRSGVIAGTSVFGNRGIDLVQAWRTTFSNQMGAYAPTDLHLANWIKTIQVTESMIDPQITTGRLDLLSVGKDVHSPNIHVAGLFGTIKIGGNYTIEPTSRTDVIEAIGPNGLIRNVSIGGRMDGDIRASVSIGPHKVGNKTGTGKFYVDDVQIP